MKNNNFAFDLVLAQEQPKQKQKKVQEISIPTPVPQSVDWHILTGWRHLDELKASHPQTYKLWKENNLIPYSVLHKEK